MVAGGVVPVIASGAEGRTVVSHVLICPEAGAAVGADTRGFGQTVGTEVLVKKGCSLRGRKFAAAVAAGKSFRFHSKSS